MAAMTSEIGAKPVITIAGDVMQADPAVLTEDEGMPCRTVCRARG